MPRIQNYLFFVVAVIILLANSSQHPTNPNGGYTGAPLDSACNQCHRRTNPNLSGSIDIVGLPDVVFAGTNYPLTVKISNPDKDAIQAGFQLVAINNILANAGEFISRNENVIVKTARGRKYAGHSPAQKFNSDTIVEWDLEWKAGDDTTVTFYVGSIIGNGKDGNNGDKALFRKWDIMLKDTSEAIVGKLINVTPLKCAGDKDAYLEIGHYGGTPPVSYNWENGDTSNIREALSAGDYSVTIIDQLGNMDTMNITITSPPKISVKLDIISTPKPNSGNGVVTAMVDGGTSPYTLEWYKENNLYENNKDTLDNLDEGNYSLTVIDNNGCTFDTSFVLGATSSINETEIQKDMVLFPHPIKDHFSISGDDYPETYNIFNLEGQLIYFQRTVLEINYISLTPGIYIIELVSDNRKKSVFKKIIVY